MDVIGRFKGPRNRYDWDAFDVLFGFRTRIKPSKNHWNIGTSYHLPIYLLYLFCTNLMNRATDQTNTSKSKEPREDASPLHHVEGTLPDVTAKVEHLHNQFKENGWESNEKVRWTLPQKNNKLLRSMRRLLVAMEKEFNEKIAETTPEPSETKSAFSQFRPTWLSEFRYCLYIRSCATHTHHDYALAVEK